MISDKAERLIRALEGFRGEGFLLETEKIRGKLMRELDGQEA